MTELSVSQARVPGTVFPYMFALPSQCTLLENFKKLFYSSVRILDLYSCFNIVRRLCSIFCVRRLKFVFFTLHYITLHYWGHLPQLPEALLKSLIRRRIR